MDKRKLQGEKSYTDNGETLKGKLDTGSGKLAEEEFCSVARGTLAQRLGDGYSLHVKEVRKNNGVKYRGLAVCKEGKNVSQVVSLEDMYRKYLEGEPMGALLEAVYEVYKEGCAGADVDRRKVTDWKEAEGRLFPKVISTEMNRELLRTVPHWEVLDLSVVIYVKLDNQETGKMAYVLAEDGLADLWGKSRDLLYETAVKNIMREGISFTNISHVMTSLLAGMEHDFLLDKYLATRESPLFVLTNRANVFGAVFMVLPQIMERIAEDMGGDVYVLPSSIHESLIVPASKVDDPALLHQLVYDVNRMQVPLADRLSDHVYLYSREKGLSIAA